MASLSASSSSLEGRLDAAFEAGLILEGKPAGAPRPAAIPPLGYLKPFLSPFVGVDRESYTIHSLFNGKLLIECNEKASDTTPERVHWVVVDFLNLKEGGTLVEVVATDLKAEEQQRFATSRGVLLFTGTFARSAIGRVWRPTSCMVRTIDGPSFSLEFPPTEFRVGTDLIARSDRDYHWIGLSGEASSYPILSTKTQSVAHILHSGAETCFSILQFGEEKAYTMQRPGRNMGGGVVKEWDLQGGECIRLFEDPSIYSFALAVTRRNLICYDEDNILSIRLLSGAISHRFKVSKERAAIVRVLPLTDEHLLIEKCEGHNLAVFHLSTGRCVSFFKGGIGALSEPLHVTSLDSSLPIDVGVWLRPVATVLTCSFSTVSLREWGIHVLREPTEEERLSLRLENVKLDS